MQRRGNTRQNNQVGRTNAGHLSSPDDHSKDKGNGPSLVVKAAIVIAVLLVVGVGCWIESSGEDLTYGVLTEPASSSKSSRKGSAGAAKKPSGGGQAPKHETSLEEMMEIPESEAPIHIIFSTGCNPFQDWQSYIFFFHAWKSGQTGTVTRIASGCNNKDAKVLTEMHEKQIRIMSKNFHLHLTPDFAHVKPDLNFKYFNKPFGLKHWLEHGLGYPDNAKEHDDSIVVLLDPDQMFVRPFTNDFTDSVEVWRPTDSKVPKFTKVKHGAPFAQQYGFGLQWKTKVNMTHVAQGEYSRIDTMDAEEAKGHYSLGPPYIATARDMYSIAKVWTDFVPRVHDNYPHLLAEMFGYCLAAAHLNLPHRVAHSFMVSDVGAGGEGWKLVDEIPSNRVCRDPPQERFPHVLHYCQRYMLGKWFIGKYRLRKDFISCDAPLLMEPPPTITELSHQIAPDGTYLTFKTPRAPKRNAFMLCLLIPRLNEAAIFFKDHHCNGQGNYNKTYAFHDDMS